jgi:hypothetical protein
MGFSVDFSDFANLIKDTDKITAFMSKAERPIVNLIGNEYKNDVQPLLQYKTGTQRRSVHVESSEEVGHPIALVGTNFIGSRQREYGGIIKAKNGPYLVFQIDGQWIQTESVYQPPHPAWRPAFENNLVKYDRMFAGVFNRVDWESDLATADVAMGLRPDLTGGYL